jgi:hypothetical protein
MKQHRSRILAVVIAAITVASCDGALTPTAPVASVSARSSLLNLDLLACTPMTADSVTQSVGSEGGTITVGPHELVIPAGSLDSTVSIRAIAPSDTINRVIFHPDGLEFGQPATLRMSYANCSGLGVLLPLRRVAYVDSSLSILDILGSVDNVFSKKVTTHLQHFSDYVVAW